VTVRDLKKISKNLNVLFVEDSTSTQIVIKEHLMGFFKTVDISNNGQEGLESYKLKKHDIIITDVEMPVMDGIEMIKNIKKIDTDQNIIVLSSIENATSLIPIINLGVDRFIPKPIEKKFLLSVISKVSLEIETLKEKNRVEKLLNQSNSELKKLFNYFPYVLFAVENGELKLANLQALELSIDFSNEGFQDVLDNLDTFLIEEIGCLYAQNITKLISLALETPDELHQIKIKIDDNVKTFKFSIQKVDQSNMYMFIMNNITEFSKIIHNNPITELPNSIAVHSKIEELCESQSSFSILLLSIENINQITKWHGQDAVMLAEIKISKNFKYYLLTAKVKCFFANFAKNSFLFIVRNDDLEYIENMISAHNNLVSYEENSNSKNQKIKINFKTRTLSFDSSSTQEVIDKISQIFQNMHM